MEVLPTMSQSVIEKANTIFNALEKSFPKVANGKLAYLDAGTISRYQANMRENKLGENTITNYLATLRSALSWAYRQKMINSIPNIEFPKMGRNRGSYRGKGRAINAEEFDRMLAKIEAALEKIKIRKANDAQQIESWRHLMIGLWLSGLRSEEAVKLSWDEEEGFAIDLGGKHPRFKIRAEAQKGRRNETTPMTPDFAQFLLSTPENKRKGKVFRPQTIRGQRVKP
jgi:integrase